MEFLVQFDITIPDGAQESEINELESAEASAAGELARDGHLVRLWRLSDSAGSGKIVGLYRADTETRLGALLDALPMAGWMDVTITTLEPHPNDPLANPATTIQAGRHQS